MGHSDMTALRVYWVKGVDVAAAAEKTCRMNAVAHSRFLNVHGVFKVLRLFVLPISSKLLEAQKKCLCLIEVEILKFM
jgi:hypothetical protein